MSAMHLRELNIGCVGGGTGLPSLLGGLKEQSLAAAQRRRHDVRQRRSSGQLRDELGVLPPGDVLKCALALARNEGEARRVLLARLPTLEQHDRLAGHTGGNLLLSMMEQYSGDFLAAVDGLRSLLGCRGRVWPVSVEPASLVAEYGDGTTSRGEVEVDARQSHGHQVRKLWLEPTVSIHPAVADAMRGFDAVIIGPGSFFTSLMPPLLVRGVKEALAEVRRADHSDRQPADRRPGHVRLHRGRCRALGVGGDRPSGRCGDCQRRPAVRRGGDALRGRAQGTAGAGQPQSGD